MATGIIFGCPASISYSIAFGIAIWIFLGGVLNITAMVSPASIALIIGIGLVATATNVYLKAQYLGSSPDRVGNFHLTIPSG